MTEKSVQYKQVQTVAHFPHLNVYVYIDLHNVIAFSKTSKIPYLLDLPIYWIYLFIGFTYLLDLPIY